MNPSREAALALLGRARGDQQACRTLLADPALPVWLGGFHAQQAVEKALKAVLAAAAVEYPRTHNLAMLVALLRQQGLSLPPDAEDLARLTPFGTAARYDDAAPADEGAVLDRGWTEACLDQTIRWASACLAGGEAS